MGTLGNDQRERPSWWAWVVGICLAAIPLVHFGGGGGEHAHLAGATAGPHIDHSPHHGGQLAMIGDLHIELVQTDDTIEIYLSDATRRPLAPTSGSVAFDTGSVRQLTPSGTSLIAPADENAGEVTVTVTTGENAGNTVEISFLLVPGAFQ